MQLLTALIAEKADRKALSVIGEKVCVDKPEFLRLEIAYLLLAVNDYPCRDRLDSSGGKTVSDPFPEHGTQLISDDTVKYPSRLLRIYKIHIDGTGSLYSRLDRFLCNFIESHAKSLFYRNIEHRCKMPCYSLALTVRVGRKEDHVRLLRLFPYLLDKVSLSAYVYIVSLKAIVDVHSECALRQVAEMPLAGYHTVSRAEIPLYSSRL